MFFKTSSLYPLALALIAGGIAAASDIARKSHAAVPVPKLQAVRIRTSPSCRRSSPLQPARP